jgi:hypothetical protein
MLKCPLTTSYTVITCFDILGYHSGYDEAAQPVLPMQATLVKQRLSLCLLVLILL